MYKQQQQLHQQHFLHSERISINSGLAFITRNMNRQLIEFFLLFLEEDEKYNEQINTLFRTVHIGTFNTSVQVCTTGVIRFLLLITTQ